MSGSVCDGSDAPPHDSCRSQEIGVLVFRRLLPLHQNDMDLAGAVDTQVELLLDVGGPDEDVLFLVELEWRPPVLAHSGIML